MSIACLTVSRLRYVCATLEKTSNVNISKKTIDATYCRNRDLGTISVYAGYFYVRFLPPI